MTLFLSHRMDRLADLLAERLEVQTPFDESWILLPSQNCKQWLQVALTERMPGKAIAGLQFLTWREAIRRVCRGLPDVFELGCAIASSFTISTGIRPAAAAPDRPSSSGIEPSAMPSSFGPLRFDPALPRLSESCVEFMKKAAIASSFTISTGIRPAAAAPDRPSSSGIEPSAMPSSFGPLRFDPALPRLSESCVEFMKKAAIASSSPALFDPLLLSRQMGEAGFYGMEKAKDWQQVLYQAIAVDGPWRFPIQILPDLPPLARQIHCFCIDDLPACVWDFLCRSQVFIYLFSPCCMFWDDVCSDKEKQFLSRHWRKQKVSESALAAFENLLRDTHPLLANWGRLGRQTKRFLEDKPLEIVEAYEESTERGASLLQSLRHDLLFLHGKTYSTPDSSIEIAAAGASRLREVQILKDNILSFLARSQGVYSDVLVLAPDIRPYEPLFHFVFGEELPYRISSVSLLDHNVYLQGLLYFFDLANGRFDADDVLKLFENLAFRARHRLTPDDLRQFSAWLKEAKVRGSWDEARQGNWAEGLKRMISGLVYLLPVEDALPKVSTMDWGQAERLDLFLSLMQLLRTQAEQFRETASRTLEEWAELLDLAAKLLFEPQEGEAEFFRTFLGKLASSHFAKASFPFSFLRSFLEADCNAACTAYQPLSLETVQCVSLEAGAVRPARAIFLLGMESGNFPRSEKAAALDWEYPHPDAGMQDRYLFLQALFAAREYLCISYCHLSPDDGKAVDPALPVQELQKTTAVRTIALPSDARCSSNAPIFWSENLPHVKQDVRIFDLKDFQLLARNPWKYFLQKRLGVYLQEDSLFSELRLEDFSLPAYQERRYLRLALQRPAEAVLEQISHELPPGLFGAWAAEQFKHRAIEWKKHLQKWGVDPQAISTARIEPIVLSSGVEIKGELDFFTPQGLLMTGDSKFFDYLRHWPSLLAFLLHTKTDSASLYSLKTGSSKAFAGIDARAALYKWVEYACRAEESLSPLIEPWADAFLRKDLAAWKQAACKEEKDDLSIRWVLERSQPLPLDRIGEQWGAFLKETFVDLCLMS